MRRSVRRCAHTPQRRAQAGSARFVALALVRVVALPSVLQASGVGSGGVGCRVSGAGEGSMSSGSGTDLAQRAQPDGSLGLWAAVLAVAVLAVRAVVGLVEVAAAVVAAAVEWGIPT